MTTYLNDFTGATAGTAITNSNSAGGGTAFNETDTPQIGSGASLVYGTGHDFPAAVVTTGATSSTARRGWSVNPTASTVPQYAVFYADRDDVVGTAFFPVRAMNADSSAQRMRVQMNNTGFLFFRDAANSQIWSSTQLSSGVLYRVEIMWGASSSASCQVKIFEGENTVPVQDSGVITGQDFGGPTQSIWFGQTSAATNTSGKLIRRVGWSDTSWLGPYSAEVAAYLETHLATGIPTPNTVAVTQRWANADDFDMRLVVSTASNLSSPVYGSVSQVDADRIVTLTATGLVPNTQYYGGVEINGTLRASGRFTFRTSPFPGDGVSHSILFGGGRTTDGGGDTFTAMRSLYDESGAVEGKPIFLADLGDNGFPDWDNTATEAEVLEHLAGQASVSGVASALAAMPYLYSLGLRDSGSGLPAVRAAYSRAIPHSSFPTDAMYHSFAWGRVKYICPDNWSERDPVSDVDGPDKRMWSQEQEDWFVSEVRDWPWIICVLSNVGCRLDGTSDGWSSYQTQFARIHNRLNAVDSVRRLVWLSADRYALAADLGTAPGTRGVPQVTAGPFDAASVDLGEGEEWGAGFHNIIPDGDMKSFGEASFSDSGGSIIVFSYVGRTADGTERVLMSKSLDVSPKVFWRTNKSI